MGLVPLHEALDVSSFRDVQSASHGNMLCLRHQKQLDHVGVQRLLNHPSLSFATRYDHLS